MPSTTICGVAGAAEGRRGKVDNRGAATLCGSRATTAGRIGPRPGGVRAAAWAALRRRSCELKGPTARATRATDTSSHDARADALVWVDVDECEGAFT